MAQMKLKRGMSTNLIKELKVDGQVLVTLDDGKIHVDYEDENNELQRKTLYGGVLTIGDYSYDGTEDVTIPIYDGESAFESADKQYMNSN